MATNKKMPTIITSRIIDLDVFRGFAVFGIFMVNILVMNAAFTLRGEWEAEQTAWWSEVSFFILETFFYSKFFVIFSLLFGMGVALQIQRAKEKGKFSNLFFLRRFGSLFLFGVLHILFIWSGDILHLYGAYGFLLLLAFRCSAKVLMWLAILVFIFPFYEEVFNWFISFSNLDYQSPLAEINKEKMIQLKQEGSYLNGIKLRIKEYLFAMEFFYTGIGPVALTMMLLGGYLVKKGLLSAIDIWLKRSQPFLIISLVVLLTYRFFLLYYIVPSGVVEHGSIISFVLMSIYYLSDISLSLMYLWLIAFFLRRNTFSKLVSPLQYAGRMAFTNYILQSVIGYVIMRSFGLYHMFSVVDCILIVVITFSLQVILSKIWLTYYKFGPLEWMWRCISYWKVLPISKSV